MKLYTRTGDDGSSGLFGGDRVSKSHLRLVAYGTLWPRGRILLWIYALLIAASRVAVTAHYPSDVLAGALVGARHGLAAIPKALTPQLNDHGGWRYDDLLELARACHETGRRAQDASPP